jgi:hypothetical protein
MNPRHSTSSFPPLLVIFEDVMHHMARVKAGELTLDEAAQIVGINPDSLLRLYTHLRPDVLDPRKVPA